MEVTSGPPAKRSRAKSKEASPEQKAKPASVTKKPRAPRKTASAAPVTTEAVTPATVVSAPPQPAEDALQGMIATAAYFLAAERHFHPGRELDDWLEAERRVRASFYG